MTEPSRLARIEYTELRATIRQRGTARVWVAVATLCSWAALTIAQIGIAAPPISCLAPLLVLAGGFEGLRTLYVGVERIGRYLQAFFETGAAAPPAWEHLAMRPHSGAGMALPPLFSTIFVPAVVVNLVPVALSGSPAELAVYGLAHVVVLVHMVRAEFDARRQRDADLAWIESFRRRNE